MGNSYKINGFGATTSDAERSLREKSQGLKSRLKDAEVETTLEIEKTVYKGTYELKGECKAPACTRRLGLESREGWAPIETEAQKKLTDVGMYKVKFQVEQYLALTIAQQIALEPKRPPAEGAARESSFLDYLARP